MEHTTSRVKKFNMFGQDSRNRLSFYDTITDIVSVIVSTRIVGSS